MPHAVRQLSLRRLAGIGALVVGSLSARGETPGEAALVASAPAVRLVWTAHPLTVLTGEPARVGVDLELPEGFHVFRDDIHLTVVDGGGLTFGPLRLPPAQPPVADRSGPWYEHDVHLELPIDTVGVMPGAHLVQLRAEVRGCTARRCHAGTQESLEVYVQVVDRDEASCPR
jgi:hypothetical protein